MSNNQYLALVREQVKGQRYKRPKGTVEYEVVDVLPYPHEPSYPSWGLIRTRRVDNRKTVTFTLGFSSYRAFENLIKIGES